MRPLAAAGDGRHADRRAGAIAVLADWVDSDPMRDLVGAFEEAWPPGTLGDVLDGLETISAKYWDFRGRDNSERWEAESPELPAPVVEVVYESGRQLGLVEESTPSTTNYDAVAVLGGGRQTPLVRSRFLADLMRRGAVSTERIFLLGSPRPVLDSERELTLDYAEGAATEFDLMNAAGEHAFGVAEHREDHGAVAGSDHPFAQWHVRRYAEVDGVHVTSISAPSSDLARRPNTGDTYDWLVRHGDLMGGESVLLVTSAWFTAFQGFDAIRLLDLPHGLNSEIVGFGAQRAPRHLSPTVLLQEVRSGVRSARQLYLSATG